MAAPVTAGWYNSAELKAKDSRATSELLLPSRPCVVSKQLLTASLGTRLLQQLTRGHHRRRRREEKGAARGEGEGG